MSEGHITNTTSPERPGGSCQYSGRPVRRSKIWLSDGNIVIQAEGLQFKVHQGYLARLSTVFADVFSMPQPIGGLQPEVDGCNILQLQDSAQGLTVVLSEIYDR